MKILLRRSNGTIQEIDTNKNKEKKLSKRRKLENYAYNNNRRIKVDLSSAGITFNPVKEIVEHKQEERKPKYNKERFSNSKSNNRKFNTKSKFLSKEEIEEVKNNMKSSIEENIPTTNIVEDDKEEYIPETIEENEEIVFEENNVIEENTEESEYYDETYGEEEIEEEEENFEDKYAEYADEFEDTNYEKMSKKKIYSEY